MPQYRPKAIDLFAGAGGLSLGLHAAGFEICIAVDNDPAAVRTYQTNISKRIIQRPIQDLSAKKLLFAAGLQNGECDLIAGGPPCQGFSVQRRGPDEDPRNSLILDYFRIVKGIRPRLFLMENVPGILSKRGRFFFKLISTQATRLGYVIHVGKLDAVHYGVPQFRRRVFLVGERIDLGESQFRFPKGELDPKKWRTVKDAIGNLPAPPPDGTPHPNFPNHYQEAKLSQINLERLRHIPPGGGREHLPDHLQLPCHRNNPLHRHLDVYGRLSWQEPAITLTARFDSFSRGRFAHPEQHRSITLREGARIQTFPDSFVFQGNREECTRQIGNAVPPMLAERIGYALLSSLRNETTIEDSFPDCQRMQLDLALS